MEKRIITISREFGSGGRTIGHLVAEKLGITEKALHLKLMSPMTFTLGEISVLKSIFNLSPRQAVNFFVPRVAYCNLSRF